MLKSVALPTEPNLTQFMAVLAHTTAFCALVWMNTGTFRLMKITLRSQKTQLSFRASLISIDADMAEIPA